jgi:hypothetical protein
MIEASSETFAADYLDARNDRDLLRVLDNELGSSSLSAPTSSELVLATYEIANHTVRLARRHYAERPERLRFVVSSSDKQNAYASWGSSGIDWIVVTEGLVRLLATEAESFAVKLSKCFPDVLHL